MTTKFCYVFGGFDKNGPLNSIERHNFSNGSDFEEVLING